MAAVTESGVATPAPGLGPAHRWRVLGIGVAANGSFAAALSGIPTTAVSMRADYRIDTGDLGWVLGAMGLGMAVSELPWGLVTDRLGDRKILLMGLALTGLLLALMACFVSPTAARLPPAWLLAVALFGVGAIGGSLNGSSGRAVMAWFQEGERGFAMSVRQMALPVGGALGALVLPTVAEHLGFRPVFGFLASLCLVTTAFAWAWLHEPPWRPASVASVQGVAPSAVRGPLRDRLVWRMVCAMGALCVPQVAVVTFAALFLHDKAHLGTGAISGCLVAFQVAAAVTRIWSGRYTDQHRNRRPFLRGCALLAAGIFSALGVALAVHAMLAAAPGALSGAMGDGMLAGESYGAMLAMSLAIGLLIVGGTVASTWHGIAFTELATLAGMRHVATALGLGNTFAFTVYFVTPLCIPHVIGRFDWQAVWFGAALAALVAFALFPRDAVRDGRASPG